MLPEITSTALAPSRDLPNFAVAAALCEFSPSRPWPLTMSGCGVYSSEYRRRDGGDVTIQWWALNHSKTLWVWRALLRPPHDKRLSKDKWPEQKLVTCDFASSYEEASTGGEFLHRDIRTGKRL